VIINAPYLVALLVGLGGHTPVPFSVGVSNVPGPAQPLYFNGARLDAIYPVSLLVHGNALNITCISYAGTLNFGLIGARDTLPHLQRLALYLGDALDELSALLLSQPRARAKKRAGADGAPGVKNGVKDKPAGASSAQGNGAAGTTPRTR
jgi:diacylglycerol O-acyltransferase / wax synthase